jgi:hypothetical protein
MTVTDEMIEAGLAIIAEPTAKSRALVVNILEAALATVKPMTENEVDSMLRNSDHDNTYDLVESVEYWFGIRE